jgi:FkbM family methyltransferase
MTAGPSEYAPDISAEEMFWQVLQRPLPGADSNVERFMLAVGTAWTKPGDFVVDLGTNHGQHARVLGAGLGDDGALLLVEADPLLAAHLQVGAVKSSVVIEVVNAAVGDTDLAEVTFFRHPERDQEGSLFRRDDSAKYQRVTVRGTSLDVLLTGHPVPTFIKIDVEGAEYSALRGGERLLREHAPLIACELTDGSWADDAGESAYRLTELIEYLTEVGWSLYTLNGRQVTLEDVDRPGFRLHYQSWMAKSGSPAEAFVTTTVPLLATAFAWGASRNPPYPFHLDRHPVRPPQAPNEVETGPYRLMVEPSDVEQAVDETGSVEELNSASVEELTETIRHLQLKTDALEQTSFDRERMVAWYAAEVSNYRNRWRQQRGIIEDHVSQEEALQAIVQDTNTRLNEVLESTSWRSTLPMRVIRRPRVYLRKLTRG